jgi:hypothetical protein
VWRRHETYAGDNKTRVPPANETYADDNKTKVPTAMKPMLMMIKLGCRLGIVPPPIQMPNAANSRYLPNLSRLSVCSRWLY